MQCQNAELRRAGAHGEVFVAAPYITPSQLPAATLLPKGHHLPLVPEPGDALGSGRVPGPRGAVPRAARSSSQGTRRRRRRGMEAAELRELRALVERAGGRRAVLLVAEVVADGAPAAATLASFARELLGDEAPPGQGVEPGCRSRSRCRRRTLAARLLLVLCRGGTARGRGSRARLREMVRDVRGRLPLGPPPAVVGVLLPGGDGEDAAVLDAMLRRHFPAAGTVQAARYSPGSPAALRECRTAACRALRAALQHPAGTGGLGEWDGGGEGE